VKENPELTFWKQWLHGPWPWLGGFDSCQQAISCDADVMVSSRRCEVTEFYPDGGWPDVYLSHVSGKICMDVGCGMDGMVPFWKHARRRILVDPLVEEYVKAIDEYMETNAKPGLNWLKGNELRPCSATDPSMDDMVGKVDGAIIFRNALDHDPGNHAALLSRVLSFSAEGCLLLFWSEFTHASSDPGHHDCDLSPEMAKQAIMDAGFEVLSRTIPVHGPGYVQGLDFGCVAHKNDAILKEQIDRSPK